MTKKQENWIQSKWRPMMAWVYMAVIIFDFIVAPVFWALLQADFSSATGIVHQQWEPITLASGGLFHMAMGAILGVTAWSRGKEKLEGVAGDRSYDTEADAPEDDYRQ